MGYRSEVSIVLLEEDYNKLLDEAKPLLEQDPYCVLHREPVRRFKWGSENYIHLYWGAVKWYQGMDDIDFVERFLRDHEHSYIRIGEDSEDIEWIVRDISHDGVFWEIQRPCTTITFAFSEF